LRRAEACRRGRVSIRPGYVRGGQRRNVHHGRLPNPSTPGNGLIIEGYFTSFAGSFVPIQPGDSQFPLFWHANTGYGIGDIVLDPRTGAGQIVTRISDLVPVEAETLHPDSAPLRAI